MKKAISKVLIATMVLSNVSLKCAFAENAYIKVDKTNFVVGTTGTIEAIGATGITLTSSDESVVSIDGDTLSAVGEGTAIISGAGMEDITVNVFAKASDNVRSYVAEDVKANKLTYSYNNRWDLMSSLRNGTDLWGYFSDGGTYVDMNDDTVFQTNDSDGACIGFVYKVDEDVTDVIAEISSYDGLETVQSRTDIAYLTDDTATFATNVGSGTTTWNDESSLTQYSVEQGVVAGQWNPAKLSQYWTKCENVEWDWNIKNTDGAPYYSKVIAKDIPDNAKFVVVLLRMGALVDGTPRIGAQRLRYRGAEIGYSKLCAGEFSDGDLKLTFNGIVSTDGIEIRKNGNVIDADISFDQNSYTATVSGDFSPLDNISVNTIYGNWEGIVPGEAEITDYDDIYFKTEKNTYIVGENIDIDLIIEKGSEVYKNAKKRSFSVDTEGIVEIDSQGGIVAKKAGTVVITPSAVGAEEEFEPVTINVFDRSNGQIESNVQDDIVNGLLGTPGMNEKMSDLRKGTKLFGLSFTGGLYPDSGAHSMLSSPTNDDSYMAFVYKLEGTVNSITTHTFGYGDHEIYAKERTAIGYLTDDSRIFHDRNGDGNYTLDYEDLTGYGIEGCVVKNLNVPISMNSDIWTEVASDDISWVTDTSARTADATVTNIPEDAKYVAVLLKLGKLNEETPALNDQFFRYKGISIDYKKNLVGLEENSAGKLVLTFDGPVSKSDITVKKNGESVTPIIENYNDYSWELSNLDIQLGDVIEIITPYGEKTYRRFDDRNRVVSIELLDSEDQPIDSLEIGMESVKARVKMVSVDRPSVYIALFNSDSRLIACDLAYPDMENGYFSTDVSLNGINVESGDVLKIFVWNTMTPMPVYDETVNNIFPADDF